MQYTTEQINNFRKEALIADLKAMKKAQPSTNFKAGLIKHHLDRLEQMQKEERTQYTNQTFGSVEIITTEGEKFNIPSRSSIEFRGQIKKQNFLL